MNDEIKLVKCNSCGYEDYIFHFRTCEHCGGYVCLECQDEEMSGGQMWCQICVTNYLENKICGSCLKDLGPEEAIGCHRCGRPLCKDCVYRLDLVNKGEANRIYLLCEECTDRIDILE